MNDNIFSNKRSEEIHCKFSIEMYKMMYDEKLVNSQIVENNKVSFGSSIKDVSIKERISPTEKYIIAQNMINKKSK